jgi:hypothetical protein
MDFEGIFKCVFVYVNTGHLKVNGTIKPFDWLLIFCDMEIYVGCGWRFSVKMLHIIMCKMLRKL